MNLFDHHITLQKHTQTFKAANYIYRIGDFAGFLRVSKECQLYIGVHKTDLVLKPGGTYFTKTLIPFAAMTQVGLRLVNLDDNDEVTIAYKSLAVDNAIHKKSLEEHTYFVI